jgi:hypothetical protein
MCSSERPTLGTGHDLGAATQAVAAYVADLQRGWDEHDATIADRRVVADVAWGSPYGATVHDFDTLFGIHQRLKKEGVGGQHARYQIERVLPISDDVVVAHVARQALDADGRPLAPTAELGSAFSEMALYVLVRRGGTWWVAAGQNTPVRAR